MGMAIQQRIHRFRESVATFGLVPKDGTLAFALALPAVVAILTTLLVGPTIFKETARDWTTYADAADRLRTGGPLFLSDGQLLYIYPPPLAAVWGLGGSPEVLLAAKLLALAALVFVIGWRLGIPAVGLLLLAPSLQHDLAIGNIMVLYALGLTWSALRPGKAGSIALGIVIALAAKPVLGPYLLWLLIVRRRDFAWTIGTAVAISAVFALVLGPYRYFEYLAALPEAMRFASNWHGNLGLSFLSPVLGTIGVVIAYGIALIAARRGEAGLPIVIGALMLAQPAYGVGYGMLLLPAIVYLWRTRPIVAVILASGLPLLIGLSYAPLAGVIMCVAGFFAGRPRPGTLQVGAATRTLPLSEGADSA
jgi:hypothetical protein